MSDANGLFQINFALPERGCQCFVCKKFLSWKSRLKRQKKNLRFIYEYFENPCENHSFSQQKMISRALFYPPPKKKGLEI